MQLADKNLTCSDCGATFVFTTGEQEFFATRGFTNEPKRCPECRRTRKSERGGRSHDSGEGSFRSAPRQTYPAVCASCGVETQVPFRPRGDRPVYCNDCFGKVSPDRAR